VFRSPQACSTATAMSKPSPTVRRQRNGPDVHTADRRWHPNHPPAEVARPDLPAPDSLCPRDQSRGWSQRSLITGVMQTTDTSLSLVPKRRILGRRLRLTTRQDPDHPTPTFLPVANDIAQRLADRTGGTAQSWLTEALFNMPITAHILGGAIAPRTPSTASSTKIIEYSATRTSLSAMARSSGQSRCESEPYDHGDGRAGDGSDSGQAGCRNDNPRARFIPPKPASGVSFRAIGCNPCPPVGPAESER